MTIKSPKIEKLIGMGEKQLITLVVNAYQNVAVEGVIFTRNIF